MKKILEVKNLKQYFGSSDAPVKAVDDISFDVYQGEVLGLVGESGSGKSTTGRAILGLYDITDGEVYFDGERIDQLQSAADRKKVARMMQMIFQDPFASLNPRMTAGELIGEGYEIHGLYTNKGERQEKINELLLAVGLAPEHANRYAHEFSGGQRQRIGIARALALDPQFIIADEAISALDVSIQAQVVNLMKELQEERNLTYLFIAHDLSMVKYISDRIAVMYQGKIVEIGSADSIYHHAVHPYTRSLLSAVPLPDPRSERVRTRQPYQALPTQGVIEEHQVAPDHLVFATQEQMDRWSSNL